MNGFVASAPTDLHGSLVQEGGAVWGQRFVAPGSGAIEITQIGIRCWGDGTADVRFAIFTDDAANARPESMVAGSDSTEFADVPAASTHAYATYSTPPQLTGGTAYWLVATANYAGMIYDRGSTTGAVNVRGNATSVYPSWPSGDDWHAYPAGSATADCGIYAVYEDAEGGGRDP